MRIIAAIDILGGKCVRLTKGDYDTMKIYNEDPLEAAKMIEDNGIKYLHLVDLDGAREKKIINHKVLEKISCKTGLIVDFGGGIRSDEDMKIAFSSGARQVTAGSIAVTNTELFIRWLSEIGNEKIILGADSINRKVATNGWMEKSDQDILDFLLYYTGKGVRFAVCTDIAKDGMLAGPSTDLYREIIEKTEVNLIASGGISSIDDIEEMRTIGCEGVIVGKAIYEGKIKLKDLGRIC